MSGHQFFFGHFAAGVHPIHCRSYFFPHGRIIQPIETIQILRQSKPLVAAEAFQLIFDLCDAHAVTLPEGAGDRKNSAFGRLWRACLQFWTRDVSFLTAIGLDTSAPHETLS